jgi:very-short-patch-repair endonuclease
LNQTIPHHTKNTGAIKGKSEAKFEQYLNRYFPRQIYTDLALIIPNFKHPYTADFTYINKEIKLFIDIEIDEPYIYNTREPRHYIGYWKDQIRNDFFNNKGWIVIRFSEEQVVRYPDSCCKFIAQQIAEITGNSAITNQFAQTPDLQPQQQWTEKEAIEMAYRKERDDYL